VFLGAAARAAERGRDEERGREREREGTIEREREGGGELVVSSLVSRLSSS